MHSGERRVKFLIGGKFCRRVKELKHADGEIKLKF